ncbi:MAG: type II toxin-antitoxin system VapC family toxin [Thermodesulfobacteriota bacterium]|nr:type II toxin-antitoxin system VapC family toxin [Thermodesulfobacteriota bacterium]
MNIYVVDASVAAKWFFEETHTQSALGLLDSQNRLHAPDFFLLELYNLLCKRIRRGEISQSEAREVRTALEQFPIQYHPFSALLDPAYEIANHTGRSLYDCLYVALATLLRGKMATADRKLYDALKPGPFAEQMLWIEDVQ